MMGQNKGLVIKNKIKNLKKRIGTNYEKLDKRYGDNQELATQIVKSIDLLLSKNASDEKIKKYLDDITVATDIIEKDLRRIEKTKELYP